MNEQLGNQMAPRGSGTAHDNSMNNPAAAMGCFGGVSQQDPMANPASWFSGDQWAIVEKLRAEDAQKIYRLLRRIQDLEGCLVYVRNFLSSPLKQQAESILWPDNID